MSGTVEPIRVLHVDDQPDLAALAAVFIERHEERITVQTATSAEQGLELLADDGIDCVISDYDMPGKNGIEFLEAVREQDSDLPFILYTGKGSEEVASDAISAGVTEYLQKEGGTDQYSILAHRVMNAVERNRIQQEADHIQTQLQAISQNSADAMVIIDPDSQIQFANSTVEDYFGYEPSTLRGERVTKIMPDRHREAHLDVINRYLETGERSMEWRNVEFHGQHRDGQEIPLSVSFSEFTQNGETRFIGIMRDISERTRLEEELGEREERFRQLAENIGEVVWMTDPEKAEMIYVNPAFEDIWGHSVEALYDKPTLFLDAVHPEDRDRVEEALEAQAIGEYDEEYRIIRPDGELRWIRDRAAPVENDAGEVYRIVGVASDVTDRKEQARKRSQIIERVTDAIVEVDADWQFTLVNEQAEELYEMSEESLLGRDFWEVFEEAKGTRFEQEYRQVMETREPTSFVEEFPRLDGWFEIEAYPRETGGISFYFRDVTTRREREQALQERVKELTAIHETSQLFQSSEQPIEEMFTTFVDSLPSSFQYPEITAARLSFGTYEVESSDFEPSDYTLTKTANIPHGAELTIEVVLTEGPPTGAEEPFLSEEEALLETLLSIVQNHLAQRERIEELERVRDLLEQTERIADVAGWEIDPDTMDVIWSENLSDLLGGDYEEEPPVEETLEQYHEADRPVIEEALDRAMNEGEPFDIEARIHRTDGDLRWFRIRCQPTATGGDVEKLRGTIQDVTEHKAHERALKRQNERLKEFASIVSHDLRNPLSVAQGRLELALDDRDWEELEAVPAALDRMETLIDDMLALASAGEAIGEVEAVALGDLAEACWRNVETDTATLRAETTATIRADESRLQQLVENLLRNAVEHGGEDVTVTIGDLPNGFYVEDDGPGIPRGEWDSVFDAGYSSSEDGAGFGLSIVRDIAEAHGWDIEVADGSEGGARFEFRGVETT